MFGTVTFIADEKSLISMYKGTHKPVSSQDIESETTVIAEAFRQWNEYLNGDRKTFSIKIKPQGSLFQMKVWDALLKIPFGETRSYGQISAQIGNKNAARAVGAAIGKNPLPVFIPCHRVIGTNGRLTGFSWGLDMKAHLLELERRI
jgi:methylated-DNA-[protein]-cysteine S-methyltransferase